MAQLTLLSLRAFNVLVYVNGVTNQSGPIGLVHA